VLALVEALTAAPCKCDMRYVKRCSDCGTKLVPVPQDTRLNEDQWDAVKAGDFYCSGTCTSGKAQSGKRYFRYRDLRQELHGDRCYRCAALAGEASDGS
jgi:hypothetical protein